MKMKKIMTLCFVVICSTSYAQTADNDTIVKIDDTKISAKIITVNEHQITFSDPVLYRSLNGSAEYLPTKAGLLVTYKF